MTAIVRNPSPAPKSVIVIGAGIVGVACAAYLQRSGHTVTIVDEREPGEMTSFGNTGGISPASVVPVAMPGMLREVPKWLLDPGGPLFIDWKRLPAALPWLLKFVRAGSAERIGVISAALASLNMPTFEAYQPLLADAGLEHLFHRTGQLFIYRTRANLEADRVGIELKRATGVQIDILGGDEIRQMEPAISHEYQAAHFIPAHGHCKNPGGLVKGLAAAFVRGGGTILRERVLSLETGGAPGVRLQGGAVTADAVVIAAGIWSAPLVRQLGYRVPLESHRGYHVTLPRPDVTPNRMILSVDDKVAISPMEMGLRIAGTVELAGTSAPPNYARARKLVEIGRRILPGIEPEGHSQWMGHRPCTPDSLPVIGACRRFPGFHFAFGHGHQGLLAASQTGVLVAETVDGRPTSTNLAPFSIERFL